MSDKPKLFVTDELRRKFKNRNGDRIQSRAFSKSEPVYPNTAADIIGYKWLEDLENNTAQQMQIINNELKPIRKNFETLLQAAHRINAQEDEQVRVPVQKVKENKHYDEINPKTKNALDTLITGLCKFIESKKKAPPPAGELIFNNKQEACDLIHRLLKMAELDITHPFHLHEVLQKFADQSRLTFVGKDFFARWVQ